MGVQHSYPNLFLITQLSRSQPCHDNGLILIGASGNANVILIVVVAVISFVTIMLLVALIAALSTFISKKKRTLKQREYTSQEE